MVKKQKKHVFCLFLNVAPPLFSICHTFDSKNPRCPSESSTLAVSGADNELSLWDLALEDDEEADKAVKGHDSLKANPPPNPTPPYPPS